MLYGYSAFITITAFILTMIMIFLRPKNMNEAVPATIGAVLVILSGSVSLGDLVEIGSKVNGAAITIMATIVMAIVLESFGLFHWIAELIVKYARGSGIRLFWLTLLLCFLMTLFFNNDGSILITTPILILILRHMKMKTHQKIPYLLSGALIATATSAPIGVSNIVNLISLKIIDMDLYQFTAMLFVPGMLGLLFLAFSLFLVFNKDIPRDIPTIPYLPPIQHEKDRFHPLKDTVTKDRHKNKTNLMVNIFIFVLTVRISLFVASYFGISVSLVAVFGSVVLLVWRWIYLKISPMDMVVKIPWHILIFAFNMYVIIFGLHNIGLTNFLVDVTRPLIMGSLFHASMTMGILISILSNLFNNHPALMIGTLTLTEMNLTPIQTQTIYLANIIGSDIGSLLLPIGTLATLIWLHILSKHKIKVSWKQYVKVTILVIPPTLIFTLVCLDYWIRLFFVP